MTTRRNHSRRYIVPVCIALAVITVIAFEPVRHNEFVDFDDDQYITANPHVTGGITLESIKWAFTRPHFYMWHPLTSLSHMLDCRLFGLNPLGHHLSSLLFHIANSVLLFLILHKMTGGFWPSALVAAIFAVHPLSVESVAWAAERKNVLSTFFWMLSIAAYIRYTRRPLVGRYLLVATTFALGLMAKPMVVTLPFVLLLLDFWPLERVRLRRALTGKTSRKLGTQTTQPAPKFSAGRLLAEKLPLLLLAAIASAITVLAQKSGSIVAQTASLPVSVRVANAGVSYLSYIGKMVFPSRLAMYYPYNPLRLSLVAVSFVVLTGITAAVLFGARRRRYLATGWLWYLGTLVPVIGLVQAGSQAMADRYTYVSGIGILIIAAFGAAEILKGWPYRKIVAPLACAIVLATFVICTRMQVRYWRDSYAAFQNTLAVTENNRIIHKLFADFLRKQGRFRQAVEQYDKALQISPGFNDARQNKGLTLMDMGDFDGALALFTQMLAANQDQPQLCDHIAVAYTRKGDLDKAVQYFNQALQAHPDWPEVHNDLGSVYAMQGKYDLAIRSYEQALRLNPNFEAARQNMARVVKLKNQTENPLSEQPNKQREP